MSRDELLKKITALDFYIIDLHLYLDTHPEDTEALNKYNDCVRHVKDLREDYNNKYGMLLANNCVSATPWQWIEGGMPWQAKYNFELTGESC